MRYFSTTGHNNVVFLSVFILRVTRWEWRILQGPFQSHTPQTRWPWKYKWYFTREEDLLSPFSHTVRGKFPYTWKKKQKKTLGRATWAVCHNIIISSFSLTHSLLDDPVDRLLHRIGGICHSKSLCLAGGLLYWCQVLGRINEIKFMNEWMRRELPFTRSKIKS